MPIRSKKRDTRPPPPPPELKVAQLGVIELMQAGEDKAPTEFRIFRAGPNESAKGIHKFSAASQSSVMEAAKTYGNDFVVDYGHAAHAFLMVDPAESGKAAGWFKAEVRNNELWASNVRWTKNAAAKLEAREYRYFSPVFAYAEDGEIRELRSVGLTNLPATYGQEPLMASQPAARQSNPPPSEHTVDLDQLIALLSLSPGATEAEVTRAVSRLIAANAQLTGLAQLTSQETPNGMLGVVTAWKTAAEQVPALQAKLTAIETEGKTAAIKGIIEKGTAEGKISPALGQQMLSNPAAWTPDAVNAYLSAATPFPGAPGRPRAIEPATMGGAGAAGITQHGNGNLQVELTQEEAQVAAMLGTSVQAVAHRKAQNAGFVVNVPQQQPPARK